MPTNLEDTTHMIHEVNKISRDTKTALPFDSITDTQPNMYYICNVLKKNVTHKFPYEVGTIQRVAMYLDSGTLISFPKNNTYDSMEKIRIVREIQQLVSNVDNVLKNEYDGWSYLNCTWIVEQHNTTKMFEISINLMITSE